MPSAAACPKPASDPDAPPKPAAFPPAATLRRFAALVSAGFRRHSTYRQAMIAGIFTNVIFGAMLAAVLSAVAEGGGRPGGYTGAQLVTYVWVGQGLLNVSYLWNWKELADRVATGDVAADLLRPVDPLTSYAAAEFGRAANAMLGRFIVPVCVGLVFYTMYIPHRLATYPLFAVSVVLATLVSFAGRYLVNLTAFWLLDVRGPLMLWMLFVAPLSGAHFPLRFLPEWAQWLIWLGTPFPSVFQIPLDIAVERTSAGVAAATVLLQLCWATALLLLCVAVQRRALRRLVVQGG
ncbi:MAG TPA: ABC-2 family transporter protein [Yinghuangia sp.]|uniref:ABC transporter permease n=1 Tax=Yinghuangia sp. YIM S10712 TaxID=3436930 RepID=UPI002C62876D|nr:ABC-2 family transporter protein [Yinghuangia sp.]